MTRVSIKRLALWGTAGLVLAAMLLVSALLSGARMFAVQTPSMAQVAPVGTLVITTPQPAYAVGDIISFTSGERTHTHRIVRVQPDGQFITKGDLNGVEDPLPTPPADVIGKVTTILPGLGWLFEGLPWLLVGSLVVYLATLVGRMPNYRQVALRIAGTTIVFCAVALWLRPWVNIDMLGFTPDEAGTGVLMHVVNTGLFPLDAAGTKLTSGQDAVVHLTEAGSDGRFILTPSPALNWWQVLIMIGICLTPLISSLIVRVDDDTDNTRRGGKRPLPSPAVTTVAIVIATTLAVTVFSVPHAMAAYTAKVQNTASTAGTNAFFTCRTAVSSLGASSTFFAYALGTTGATETDLSGNGRTGRYMATVSTSASVGCDNDTPKASVTFNGTSQCLYMNSNGYSQNSPNTFSIEARFRTGTKSNGRIVGFGNVRNSAADTTYDRHIYLDKDGRIVFGVYPSAIKLVATPAGKSYADNAWHHVIATLGSSGMRLYVDGTLVDSDTSVTTAETDTGWWKVGCGNLANWQNAATYDTGSTTQDYSGPSYFTGQIQYAAVYTQVLSAAQVKEHYQAG